MLWVLRTRNIIIMLNSYSVGAQDTLRRGTSQKRLGASLTSAASLALLACSGCQLVNMGRHLSIVIISITAVMTTST
jgi:hypothetical protein